MTPADISARSWPYTAIIEADYVVVDNRRDRLSSCAAVVLALGLSGFIPSGAVGWTMPLPLAIGLTLLGAAALYWLGRSRPTRRRGARAGVTD